jgi:hypothetical protein
MTDEEEADAWTDRIMELLAAGRWEDAIKVLEELAAEIERRKNAKKHANGDEG